MDWEPAFVLGTAFGALLLFALQAVFRGLRRTKSEAREPVSLDKDEARRLREVDDLHARLAVLERIATDPAARTASEIEGLRGSADKSGRS